MVFPGDEAFSFKELFPQLLKKSRRTVDLEARQDIIDKRAQAERTEEQKKIRTIIEKDKAKEEQMRHSTSPFCTREMTQEEFSKNLKHKNFHDPREQRIIQDVVLGPLLIAKVKDAQDWIKALTNTESVTKLGLTAAYLPEKLPELLNRFLSPREKYVLLQTSDRFFGEKTIIEIVIQYHPKVAVALIEDIDFLIEDKAKLRSKLPEDLLNHSPIEKGTPRSPFRALSSAETVITTPRGFFRPVDNSGSPATNRVLGFSPVKKQQ